MTTQIARYIKSFTWEECQGTPCEHVCEITFIDSKVRPTLTGEQIRTVLNEIKQKVKRDTSHFDSCKPATDISYRCCCIPVSYELTAMDVLGELFNTTVFLNDETTPLDK